MKLKIAIIFQKLFSKFSRKIYARYFKKFWKRYEKKYRASRNHKLFPRLVFLPVPLINNKYFANALKKKGYVADTLMTGHFSISNKADFDIYFHEITDKLKLTLKFKISFILGAHEDYLRYKIFDYAVLNYDVFVMPFSGGVLSNTPLKNYEAQLLHSLGAKTATFAYGYDFWQYSKIADTAYRHAIIANYPEMGRREYQVNANYKYWAEHSDFIMGSMATDGLGRWDMLPVNYITIDTDLWRASEKKSKANGIDGVVKISHSPNHRYVKGTEFIIDAVSKLKSEGVLVELILIEKKTNEEVRKILQNEVDIHIEQLVYTGYALSAIEGMACGLPVISNEENEFLTRVLRRYSFLNECPIVSASPENIIEVLRCLINNPSLRNELGIVGKKYAEKYHSEKTAQAVFAKIIDKIWFEKECNLMSFFHPLNPESYNNSMPKIEHPLIENKIPTQYYNNVN